MKKALLCPCTSIRQNWDAISFVMHSDGFRVHHFFFLVKKEAVDSRRLSFHPLSVVINRRVGIVMCTHNVVHCCEPSSCRAPRETSINRKGHVVCRSRCVWATNFTGNSLTCATQIFQLLNKVFQPVDRHVFLLDN